MANDGLPEGFDWKPFTPDDSPKTPMDVNNDPVIMDLFTPSVAPSEPAFFFSRPLFDFSSGAKVETGQTFDLQAASSEKPVALIFGSYT
jgi:hypothetical protein